MNPYSLCLSNSLLTKELYCNYCNVKWLFDADSDMNSVNIQNTIANHNSLNCKDSNYYISLFFEQKDEKTGKYRHANPYKTELMSYDDADYILENNDNPALSLIFLESTYNLQNKKYSLKMFRKSFSIIYDIDNKVSWQSKDDAIIKSKLILHKIDRYG